MQFSRLTLRGVFALSIAAACVVAQAAGVDVPALINHYPHVAMGLAAVGLSLIHI